MTRFVFVTGGVVSSLGKGIAAASIGALLQERGFSVKLRKLDPYINVDPGTISPFRHGEVYVTEDGAETDLDLGHYERFTGVSTHASDNLTTGKVYSSVIAKERKGDYLGSDVQVIPHITDEIKKFILSSTENVDFVICEIGGTVGDIEGLPFLEAIRQLHNELETNKSCIIHLTLLPYIASAGELKTKPSQHSVRALLNIGIQPDFLICRSDRGFSSSDIRKKLALFCNVLPERIIDAPDVSSIYEVPVNFHKSELDHELCKFFKITSENPTLEKWKQIIACCKSPESEVTIGVFGKYANFVDAYKSLQEAISHAGFANYCKVNVKWVDTENLEITTKELKTVQGIIVPGGFGQRGINGKIEVIKYARENNIPFLGICLGMQLAVIEVARNLLNINDASSTELGSTSNPVVGLLTEWKKNEEIQYRTEGNDLGGTMRLGAYECKLLPESLAWKIYNKAELISERHRHRYEVNSNYTNKLNEVGVIFSGTSPDGTLPEILEYKFHPWFIGVQFHPEFKSRPFKPHPLFVDFIKAVKEIK